MTMMTTNVVRFATFEVDGSGTGKRRLAPPRPVRTGGYAAGFIASLPNLDTDTQAMRVTAAVGGLGWS